MNRSETRGSPCTCIMSQVNRLLKKKLSSGLSVNSRPVKMECAQPSVHWFYCSPFSTLDVATKLLYWRYGLYLSLISYCLVSVCHRNSGFSLKMVPTFTPLYSDCHSLSYGVSFPQPQIHLQILPTTIRAIYCLLKNLQ